MNQSINQRISDLIEIKDFKLVRKMMRMHTAVGSID